MPLFVEYSEPKTEAKPHDNPKTGASACSSSATPSAGPKQLSAADHHAEADACCHPPELAAGKPAPALIGMVRPESHLSTPMHLHRHPPDHFEKNSSTSLRATARESHTSNYCRTPRATTKRYFAPLVWRETLEKTWIVRNCSRFVNRILKYLIPKPKPKALKVQPNTLNPNVKTYMLSHKP